MTRRTYTMQRRAEFEAATRERIVRATVKLHAEHGSLATSYAMIAQRAGVAPQTVYNHFPEPGALFGACTGHVFGKAPALDVQTLRAGRTPTDRLRLLAQAVFARYAFLEPWMRIGWYEAALIPELGAILARGNAELRQLIATAIAPEHEPAPAFLDATFVLVDFPAWQKFSRSRSQAEAARIAGDCLAGLLPHLTHARTRKGKP